MNWLTKIFKKKNCPNCGDDSGWDYVLPYGWVCCADCNDDAEKPIPLKASKETVKRVAVLRERIRPTLQAWGKRI